MTEHECGENDDVFHVPGGFVAIAQRYVVSTLENSNHERLRHFGKLIRKWPEILGEKTTPLVDKIANIIEERLSNKPVPPEDREALDAALRNRPSEAAAVMGLLTADLLDITGAKAEREALLGYYQSSLNLICMVMSQGTTSLALRGFVHNPACVSYWHFEQQNLKFSSVDTFLYPYGFKVYLLETEPTDEKLESLNLQIRDSDNRQLSPELYDVNRDPTVSVLKHIYETRVTFEQLHRNHATMPPQEKDAFGLSAGPDYSKPILFECWIPPEPDALVALVDSLQIATAAQGNRLEQARQGQQLLAGKRTPDNL